MLVPQPSDPVQSMQTTVLQPDTVVEQPIAECVSPQETEDPLRQYLNRRESISDRDRVLFPVDERRIQEIARDRISKTVQQAEDALCVIGMDNNQMKACLKVLNVAGAHNARQLIKRKIIAVKLVQHKLTVGSLVECLTDSDKDRPVFTAEKHRMIRKLPKTAVKVVLSPSGALERLAWLRGDVPTYDEEGEVVPGKSLHEVGDLEEIIIEDADFEPSEYCRLLHVLADERMADVREVLLDKACPLEIWSKDIAVLFNDETFAPEPITQLAGGVKITDIDGLAPQVRQFIRDGGTLKRKFNELKAMYRAAVRNFSEQSQEEDNTFRQHSQNWPFVMYAFCLSNVFSEVQPLLSKAFASDYSELQRIGESEEPPLKRRRMVGSDRFSPLLQTGYTYKSSKETALLTTETRRAERDRALAEATDAFARAVSSLLGGIRNAQEALDNATSEEDRELYASVLKELKTRLISTTLNEQADPEPDAI